LDRSAKGTFVAPASQAGTGQEQTDASRFQRVRERAEGEHLLARPGNTTKL
jgi:hypothetical protein